MARRNTKGDSEDWFIGHWVGIDGIDGIGGVLGVVIKTA